MEPGYTPQTAVKQFFCSALIRAPANPVPLGLSVKLNGMNEGRSYRFSNAITRQPGNSVAAGLRAADSADPDAGNFLHEHNLYTDALRKNGAKVVVLDAQEQFPDSVFIEDAALCVADTAIVLRPGAPSRFDEAAALAPVLQNHFRRITPAG
jgi:dimethylargininase